MGSNPILVTGSPRCGSTWLGKMLTQTPFVIYIDEPFNPISKSNLGVDQFYTYINQSNEQQYMDAVDEIVNLRNTNRNRIQRSILRFSRPIFKMPRPLLKDPIACFSTEWLAHRYNMNVVVLIRHPAAVADSFMKQAWSFGIEDMIKQDQLMADWLHPYEEQLNRFKGTRSIEEYAWGWRMIYHVLGEYIKRNPEWIVVTHEVLSVNSQNGISDLYRQLEIPFTSRAKLFIEKSVSSENPVRTDDPHNVYRNSAALVKNWKKRLSEDDIKRIREITEPVASQWYDDQDW